MTKSKNFVIRITWKKDNYSEIGNLLKDFEQMKDNELIKYLAVNHLNNPLNKHTHIVMEFQTETSPDRLRYYAKQRLVSRSYSLKVQDEEPTRYSYLFHERATPKHVWGSKNVTEDDLENYIALCKTIKTQTQETNAMNKNEIIEKIINEVSTTSMGLASYTPCRKQFQLIFRTILDLHDDRVPNLNVMESMILNVMKKLAVKRDHVDQFYAFLWEYKFDGRFRDYD